MRADTTGRGVELGQADHRYRGDRSGHAGLRRPGGQRLGQAGYGRLHRQVHEVVVGGGDNDFLDGVGFGCGAAGYGVGHAAQERIRRIVNRLLRHSLDLRDLYDGLGRADEQE